jgi:hypothetical protein
VTGQDGDVADNSGQEEDSRISDIEEDGGQQGPGVNAEGGGNGQPHGVIADDLEEDDAGDAEGSGGRAKKRRGVPKAKRWTHKKVKGPSKIRPPNSKFSEEMMLRTQSKEAPAQAGSLQRSN